ncbi:hypothetical protein D9M71_649170 [compost metagenome]
MDALVGVLQVVDQVIGHRERAAHADHVDVVSVDHQIHGLVEGLVIEFQPQPFDARQGGVDAFARQVAAAGLL